MKESNSLELLNDDLVFHFVPEIGENIMEINEDVKQYVNHFFYKLCIEYNTKPNSIGLIGNVLTLTKVVGRLVQDYEKYKGLNGEFTLI
ncbi:hypothetical protein [Flavobacterium sp. W22_SRS_FP1]|uniref:hypothetical protein n=1 Tax=Flavobacterium sp. W22_SRS_FP1 TaxID=3240276 RepID=UPI003F8F4883